MSCAAAAGARRRVSRRRAEPAATVSTSTISSASSNCGARAMTVPSWSTTSESPSKTSSSWPPTSAQNATAVSSSRARWAIIRSRSTPLPAWYGEAEMLTIRRAPDSASSDSGGPGCQMSSQTVRPIVTPSTSIVAPRVPGWK